MTHQTSTHHHGAESHASDSGAPVHHHHSSEGHHHGTSDSVQERPPAGFVPDSGNATVFPREALPEGCGKGNILFFDASSGIAGDMTIAALVHLGVPFAVVLRAVDALGLSGYHLSVRTGHVGAIGAYKFDVEIAHSQHERHYGEICELIRKSSLPTPTIDLALRMFRRLGEAEATVHGIAIERVHFHEVGALDSIADIVGAAAAIEYLGAEIIASPLPLGHGFVHCRHGVIPLPAPATLECLRGVPTYSADIEAETVTPTGAAIIATVARRFAKWPEMTPERIGWGAGSHAFVDRPNVLRVVLGRANACDTQQSGHVVLEANVDDMTGELIGYVLSLLMQSGALDAWAVPVTMKKGRPGVVLSAIVAPEDGIRLSELILRETTTLGVRRTETARSERPRHVIQVATRYGSVPVKVGQGPYGPAQLKPEFDACVRLAEELRVPVREVIAEALAKARQLPLV
jgi:pyridinium-3,5-bisthiocarboxylic acid mononucleotide nickel chelatase